MPKAKSKKSKSGKPDGFGAASQGRKSQPPRSLSGNTSLIPGGVNRFDKQLLPYLRFDRAPYREDAGGDGLRIHFLARAGNMKLGNASFSVFTDLAAVAFYYLDFNPNSSSSTMGGPIASIAAQFARYAVPQLNWHYRPVLGTSALASADTVASTIGWLPDASLASAATPTYDSVCMLPGAEPIQYWVGADGMCVRMKGDGSTAQLLYMHNDSSTVGANIRLSSPGALIGASETKVGSVSVEYGNIFFSGVLDLYDMYTVSTEISKRKLIDRPRNADVKLNNPVDVQNRFDAELKEMKELKESVKKEMAQFVSGSASSSSQTPRLVAVEDYVAVAPPVRRGVKG